jgi:DNA-binding transcriptional LysR family regulator
MNLRFVEAFYWAVTLRSVTRASEKLFITQSALSSRIAALETELGVLLLDRRDKQFRLTQAGSRFARHAERLLNLQRDIKAEFGNGMLGASDSAAPRQRPLSLRLGVIESVLHSWLIGWIQALRSEHPTLELALNVETTPVLVDQLKRGTADLVITVLPASGEGVMTRALAPMPMVFAGPPRRHGDRAPRRRTLAALAEAHELLTFQRGSQPHLALLALCKARGIDAARVHTISSISAMVQLVEQGFGIATLPLAAVRRLGLTPLAMDTELTPLPIHLSWRDDPANRLSGSVIDSVLAFNERPAANAGRAKPAGASSKKVMRA